jgi:Na+-transporting NADH:ubiquinone oxidoreductase subunit C
MTGDRESVGRTLLVAGGVAAFCALMVSSAVYWLRPIQAAYQSIERNHAIVAAAGLIDAAAEPDDRELVSLFLRFEPRLVDLTTDRYADTDARTAAAFDYREAGNDPARSMSIAAVDDTAGIGRRPRMMPVYELVDGNAIEVIVLPVYGRGMWSTIHGYIGLGPDLTTIVGVTFYEHGETPGIGDRIQNEAWLANWHGKRIYGPDGTVALRIGTRAADTASESRIDAITGATVTVTAVERLVLYWFGADGYGPFLAGLRGGAR